MQLSVVLITLNSEKTLKSVLEAVSWADEIILVDSGSTDKTLEIAQQFKAKIVYRVFDGYGSQKNFATEQASHDWILSLDDDEILTPELQNEIQDLDLINTDYQGFKIPRSLIFLGKLLRFSGEYRRLTLRLFNRKYGNWNAEYVHESVEVKGKIGTLKNQILHDSYRDLTDFFNKFNKYTSLGAKTLARTWQNGFEPKNNFSFPDNFFKNLSPKRLLLRWLRWFYVGIINGDKPCGEICEAEGNE